MAFVWILMLLVIINVLSLSFLQKAVIGTSAAASRISTIQTHYLARSAANHALWRLLNDPDFAPTETDYDMHDFGEGRYGYKVRKPSLTRFGTVAAVGAVGTTVSRQSYVQYLKPYDIMVTYGLSSGGVPKNRRLLGASWQNADDTVDIGGSTVTWMVLQGAPNKKEMIMGTLDSANAINFAVWNGTSWDDRKAFTTTSLDTYLCFDIAYETLSGEALVVGRYAAGDTRYNIWTGTAWAYQNSQEDTDALNPESNLTYIDMASNPNSDEILIGLIQGTNDLKIVQWDGSAFHSLDEIDTATESDRLGSVEIVYEQQSGHALILWGHALSHQIYYAMWNGATLSGVGLLPDFGNDPKIIRAAADPTSDYIVAAAVDDNEDLNVAVWDGSAWTDSRELETSGYASDEQMFDIAWAYSGREVIVAWAPSSGNNIRYFKWTKGTALADHSVENGPDVQAAPQHVRLLPISDTEKIVLLTKNASDELRYSLWIGNKFLGDPSLLLNAGIEDLQFTFNMAESGTGYTGGSG